MSRNVWRVIEPTQAQATIEGWKITEHAFNAERRHPSSWTFTKGERVIQFRSKRETALRRLAHVLVKGEWNDLTRESHRQPRNEPPQPGCVPADVDARYDLLLEEYDSSGVMR